MTRRNRKDRLTSTARRPTMRLPKLRSAHALCLAILLWPALPAWAQAEAPNARVIVKFKSSADGTEGAPSATQQQARVQGMARRLGITLRDRSGPTERSRLVMGRGIDSREMARRLAADADVEYAVPDERRHRLSAPNDPRYANGQTAAGPAVGQWYLRAPEGDVKSSIDIEGAWSTLEGKSRRVVVAVLDTGVRFDHPDLRRFADGGTLLDGYDFVTNDFIGNDNSPGRDSDPSDPGDWLSADDLTSEAALAINCTSLTADVGASSWHGTQTAGLIGATTQNARGMAGIGGPNRNVLVLPLRVLGKCGGFDSDIIPAMRWAAGLSVPGLPKNPNPARVINLSLGGVGECSAAYQDAIREINKAGVVVVAAAGNSSGGAVNTPANCTGVIAVAGLRHTGTKVGYSDLGPEIALSAPAGNCVNLGGVCLYPLLTTSNSGTTTPVAADEIYTDDGSLATYGTSFSSPLVAGTAALMLVAQPELNPDEVSKLLRQSVRAFPSSGEAADTPQCAVGSSSGSSDEACYCTTSTCGAGMLNAGAAVALAKATEPASKSMAGALGWGWLAALAVAVLALARTRRTA